jgi:hypothetical protein
MSTARTVPAVGSCVLAVFLTLVEVGCRSDRSPVREPRPVMDAEWRAVFADWYKDGEFDRSHRCLAVLAARRHLPSRSLETQSLHDDISALEESAC